jgi:hypothetical protein
MYSLSHLDRLLPYLAQPLVPMLFALSRYVRTRHMLLTPRVMHCMRKRACRRLIERILLEELMIVLVFAVLGVVEALWHAEICARHPCPQQPREMRADKASLFTCEVRAASRGYPL